MKFIPRFIFHSSMWPKDNTDKRKMDPREKRTSLLPEAGKLLLRTVFEFSSFLIFEFWNWISEVDERKDEKAKNYNKF